MNPVYQNIFTLTKAAIYCQTPEPLLPPNDWTQQYDLLRRGKLQGIVYKTVASLPEQDQPVTDFLNTWKSTVFFTGFQQLAATQEIRFVLQEAKKQELVPVLFKGLTLAALYPEPSMRFSSDADLFIQKQQRPAMEALLISLGYSKDDSVSKEHVPVYRIDQNNRRLSIELHDCLWEDYTGAQADLLESINLTNPDTLLDISPFGFPIRTLGHEEHLVYQVFHIAKHFAFEGMRLRFLTDITLFVNAYEKQINWKHFWQTMEKLGYSVFCNILFQICITCLGMTNSFPKPEASDSASMNELLITDIVEAGKVGEHHIENWASTEMLASYFMREAKTSSGLKRKLEIFFPMPADLKDKFSYAKKYPVLLPVAWIHRFFSAIRYSIMCKLKKQSAADVLSNAEYRLSLMKSVGLVDEK